MEKTKFLTSENYYLIQEGWYRYEDGTFSKLPDSSKKIVGVVGLVDSRKPRGQRIKSIGLEEIEMRYCNKRKYFCTDSSEEGQENTKSILEKAAEDGIETAAEWCVNQGGYLEAGKPLSDFMENRDFLNSALEKIGAEPIASNVWYASSSEDSFYPFSVWAISICKNKVIHKMKSKSNLFRFRCVFSD